MFKRITLGLLALVSVIGSATADAATPPPQIEWLLYSETGSPVLLSPKPLSVSVGGRSWSCTVGALQRIPTWNVEFRTLTCEPLTPMYYEGGPHKISATVYCAPPHLTYSQQHFSLGDGAKRGYVTLSCDAR